MLPLSSIFRRRFLGAVLFSLAAFPAFAGDPHILPDPVLTPGGVLAGVTEDDVCQPGYAASVRHVSAATKRSVFAHYGLDGNHTGYCAGPGGCEVDHLVSLELGGSNDEANLWPEPYDGPWNAHVKDKLENRLHRMVCNGEMSLSEAQRLEASDWISAYRRFVGAEPVAVR